MSSFAKAEAPPEVNSVITLNIGGTCFSTTKATLTGSQNYFTGLFKFTSEGFGQQLDSSGNLFIDRDPTNFRYILNQLRDGSVCLPDSHNHLNEILREAEFFAIQPLVEHIYAVIKEQKDNHKNGKSSESQYVVVENVEKHTFNEIFTKHTSELGYQLVHAVQMEHCRAHTLVFQKQLSNGQANLLTSLMNMANR
jgi:hypothetical protein